MANNVYEMVTERICSMLEQGIIPWRKPWSFAGNDDAQNYAISYTSRQAYSQINQWLLCEPGEYLTFNQIQAQGGQVKKGEKAKFVVFFKQVPYKEKDPKTGEEELKSFPMLRYYNVFHINQTEGVKSKVTADPVKVESKPVDMCPEADEAIMAYVKSQIGLKFQNDKPSSQAYYSPVDDKVVVPMRNQFKDMEEYYSTAFHELTHSTLIESRCNRRDKEKVSFFGSKEYSREELVAEIGSAMLCGNFHLDGEKVFRNHIAYLQSWVKNLKSDPKAIVFAASRAEKAARFILGERAGE